MTMPVRVMVQDAWDEVRFDVAPALTLGELKWNALAVTRVTGNPASYLLKYRGAELGDESLSLEAAGVVPNGALIVMPRRRRPVR
ncbi:MAG TPA: hypothetical protein VFT93_04640 [Candidatus Eisenbacteria bacterium]|jgi:hypothetical protein|nr:hypothetical protein [Candidatus Eisenbacteria bacterium]